MIQIQHLFRSGLILAGICLAFLLPASAQQKQGTVIKIIQADTLNTITRDSVQLTKFLGNAIFQQGTTLFYCDSAIKNNRSNVVEAYGHIHINQADSVHIYGDYLHYDGNSRIATLRRNARLTDGKVTITGPELVYDMNAKIGTYVQGGKLVNGKSVLTSKEGYYYADTKEMHFQKDVLLVDPEYTLATDALLYNTETKIANIIAPTTINESKRTMYVTSGYYDTDKGYGNFTSRPTIEDSTGTITADNIEMDKLTGLAYANGNMVYRDTVRKMSLLANHGTINQKEKTILATQKPLLILERGKDTLYMAADTLFSGVHRPTDSIAVPGVKNTDTTQKAIRKPGKGAPPINGKDTSRSTSSGKDSSAGRWTMGPPLSAARDTGIHTAPLPDIVKGDSLAVKQQQQRVPVTVIMQQADSAIRSTRVRMDSIHAGGIRKIPTPHTVQVPDTLDRPTGDSLAVAAPPKDTTEQRYILAYHHVKIFSDSLQGVADSVYYTTRDSAFRFYRNPVLWSNSSQQLTQLTGDTILLFTKNQTADKMVLHPHGFIANQAGPGLFNQIKGNEITGYVAGETLDWMHVDGNAETIYYIKDDGGGFMSVNKALCAIINIYFEKGELGRVVLIKDPEGTMYPFTQRPKDQMELEGFKWQIERRPKSKAELMQ